MMKAIVTGITGQDGHYMAQLLLKKGIAVVGITSRPDTLQALRDEFHHERFSPVLLNFAERGGIVDIVRGHQPDLFFNFAALATGSGMFANPALMSRINGEFVLDILEAARTEKPSMRICQASSAEMYGDSDADWQSEETPFKPKSPYGAAKLYAHNLVAVYRAAFGIHATSAILFNHESVRRPIGFVTRKITNTAARIRLGMANELSLGSLDTMRDWGCAPEYVDAMFRMAMHAEALDFVVATGEHSTIRSLCQVAFEHVGLDYRDHVRVDTSLARSIETKALKGCPERIFEVLGWKNSTPIADVIRQMVDHDLALLKSNPG